MSSTEHGSCARWLADFFLASPQPIVFQSIKTPTWLIIAGFVCVVANSLPSYLVRANLA